MARPITWREWDAMRSAQALLSVRFTITPLGRQMLRQAEGRRTVEAEARTDPHAVVTCIWCKQPIRRGQPFTVVGREPMHDTPCREEFDKLTAAEGRDA